MKIRPENARDGNAQRNFCRIVRSHKSSKNNRHRGVIVEGICADAIRGVDQNLFDVAEAQICFVCKTARLDSSAIRRFQPAVEHGSRGTQPFKKMHRMAAAVVRANNESDTGNEFFRSSAMKKLSMKFFICEVPRLLRSVEITNITSFNTSIIIVVVVVLDGHDILFLLLFLLLISRQKNSPSSVVCEPNFVSFDIVVLFFDGYDIWSVKRSYWKFVPSSWERNEEIR